MSDAPRPMPEILAELQAAADEATAQRLRFGYIADTIRVNALRNGATTEQVEEFIHGRASFVNWMAELIEARGKTENAALQSRVAELEAANRGLVRLNEATEARAEAAEAALVRALPTTAAERDVLTERSRQIVAEGWNASHDDAHAAGELSVAAACYALLSAGWSRVALWEIWPKKWGVDWLKDCDPRRAKVKAAALIIADIERLDRARRSGEASGGEP